MNKTIVVAGGTGNLGERIIKALLERNADVRVLVRSSSDPEKIKKFEQLGVSIHVVDMSKVDEVSKACVGASCVVSALSGLGDVIIDAQKVLLDAAVAAGVPRFIPSDFALDFTKIPGGNNRNLDFRRTFQAYLDASPIAATSILNGPFADMLTGEMPLIVFKLKRILYWGNADQRMDFTTIDDTAVFTANVALDSSTPRFLRIAGDQLSARDLASVATKTSGEKYKMFRLGSLERLGTLIKIARWIAPGEKELYPPWQGMQYMRDMLDGRAAMQQLDNNHYPDMQWTSVQDVLTAHHKMIQAK